MSMDEIKHLVIQLAAITERLDQRSEAAVAHCEGAARSMDQRAQLLGASAHAFTQNVASSLQQQAGDIIGAGIKKSLDSFNDELGKSARLANAAGQALEAERRALNQERKTWMWAGCGALIIGSILATGASAYTVYSGKRELDRQRLEGKLLSAYQSADIALCGERLCARIDPSAPAFGNKKDYRQIKTR
jgi:hypothetical protein